ncbi:MAG TPA: lipid-A-disaccharide synthase [Polyangiaceae bacterium]|nr:lipid-A-disaccharide synthase [Polyangiaceae bacterium]
MSQLLVVCGEPSSDRAAADVIARLPTARAFGLVGPACEAAGVVPLVAPQRSAALGVLDVALRAGWIARAMASVRRAISERKPRAALLVNYTEFNARLLGPLRRAGVRVLWYAAPQIWAWRARRGAAIARGCDAMAVILPFEEALWRERGAAARYVGHPSLEIARRDREEVRRALGLDGVALAILPGSRPAEVRRLLPAMIEAASGRQARVLLTRALDSETRAWARERAAGVPVVETSETEGAAAVLGAFDVALCASGTASLECAIANVPPVVAYRVDALAAFVAKRALTTKHVALPNVLLGRRAFPELLQDEARADRMREALGVIERDARAREACEEVRARLGTHHAPSREVAEMLRPWL